MTRKLQVIILILLILIYISSNILLKEMKNAIPEIDYTIYTFPPETESEEEIDSNATTLLQKIIASFKEDSKERKYKYYKKLKLINYCKCDECRSKWIWGDPPPFKMLTNGMSVAANPKTLEINTHLRIGTNYFIVHYNDNSIPTDTIYVYLDHHERNNESLYMGIYDVYKEK